MIQCHGCHNYFHGNCIGISRLKATLLKHFYCPVCVDRDPTLVTEFAERAEKEEAATEDRRGGAAQQREVKRSKYKKNSRR